MHVSIPSHQWKGVSSTTSGHPDKGGICPMCHSESVLLSKPDGSRWYCFECHARGAVDDSNQP